MDQEPTWRLGNEWHEILGTLRRTLSLLESSARVGLHEVFLQKLNVEQQPLDLTQPSAFFEPMAESEFHKLPLVNAERPNKPVRTIKFPRHRVPKGLFDHEDCTQSVWIMFQELHCTMISPDGSGCTWSESPTLWYPRKKYPYEFIGGGSKSERFKPWKIVTAYDTCSNKPHMVYHVIHSDTGKDGIIGRSELEVLVKTMKGRMEEAQYCTHIAPVRSICRVIHYLQQLT